MDGTGREMKALEVDICIGKGQGTNEHDDVLNVCDLFNGSMLKVRDEWQIAAVQPVEDSIPAKYLEGHTQCIYVGS